MKRTRAMHPPLLILIGLLVSSCATSDLPRSRSLVPPASRAIPGAVFDRDGERLWFVREEGGSCNLRMVDVRTRVEQAVAELSFCPRSIHRTREGLLATDGGGRSSWFRLDGGMIDAASATVAAIGAENRIELTGGELLWVHGAKSEILPSALDPHRLHLLRNERGLVGVWTDTGGEKLVRWTEGGWIDLTPSFAKIDSFDLDPDELEFVISALRDSFDVAIGSTDGGELNWIFPEAQDEAMVSWAPRGNKVAYRISAVAGDLIRTVHVPTGFMVMAEFPWSRVEALAWEPRAERYAVVLSSLSASDHVVWLGYEGDGKQTLVPPRARLGVEIDLLAAGATEAILLRPATLRYGETYPLILWFLSGRPRGWLPVQASVLERGPAGMILLPDQVSDLGAGFWQAVGAIRWQDPELRFAVVPHPIEPSVVRSLVEHGFTVIVGDAQQTAGTDGNATIIKIPAVEPEAIESLAAEALAKSLEAADPPNGPN